MDEGRPPEKQIEQAEDRAAAAVRRRRRAVVGVSAVFLVAIVGVALVQSPDPLPDGRAPGRASEHSGNAMVPAPVEPRSDVFDQTAAVEAFAPDPDREVCGAGLSLVSAEPPIELNEERQAQADSIRKRLASQLASSADARERAVGLRLQRRADMAQGANDLIAQIRSRCGQDEACINAAAEQTVEFARTAGGAATEALAKLASTSNDSFVYALAMDGCHLFEAASAHAPSCGLLNAAQWARIDGDNVIPWLHVAADARARSDQAATDEALFRASRAQKSVLGSDELMRIVLAAAPPASSGFERAQVLEAGVGEVLKWALPAYQTVTSQCGASALADGNRSQVCNALAESFVGHPSSLLEFLLGGRLAERLNWPTERLATLRDDREAISAVMQDDARNAAPAWSCRAYANLDARWRSIAEKGELGAARERIAASGKSTAELAADWRRARDAAVRIEQAASAASGAVATPYSSAPPQAR